MAEAAEDQEIRSGGDIVKGSKRLVLAAALACAAWAVTAMAATEAQKLNTIEKGLSILYAKQQAGGYWNYGGYEQAATGAAAFAFLSQKDKWGANAAQYQAAVDNAMGFLLGTATITPVGARDDGYNPCGSGTCTGVYWYGAGESTYSTGLVAPALATYAAGHADDVATTSGPLENLTWRQIAQGITNLFAASQSTVNNGNRRGGWRYYPGEGDSDSSTTQWAVISLIYDETLGATTPQFVKSELQYWLAAAQVSGQGGAACYQPDYLLCDHADTGGLLLGLKFVGDNLSNFQVRAALSFLNTNWQQSANNTFYGNFGNPYAMWAIYKGLETNIGLNDTTTITNFLTSCGAPGNLPGNPPGSVACNWWEDYNQWLVDNQNPDGSWSGYEYWVDPLSTAFDLSIMGATAIPTVPCISPPSNLVSWWPGDGYANDVADGNPGSLMNGASFAPGLVGQAFSFDGVDDYVSIGNPSNLQFGTTGDFTVDAWVNFNSLPPGGGGPSDMVIVSKMGSDNTGGWLLLMHVDQHFWFCLGSSVNGCGVDPTTSVTSTTVAVPGTWYHVAGVRSPSGIAIYVNGVLEDSKPLPSYVNTDVTALLIGAAQWGAGPFALMHGLIDEVEIYNRDLSAAEIQAIFNAGSSGKCKPTPNCVPPPSGLVSWWPGEGYANDIIDGNSGALLGGVTFAPGEVGQAFSFDGTGEVVVEDNPNLDLQQMTIDAWVYPTSVTGLVNIIVNKENGVCDLGSIQYEIGIAGQSLPADFAIPVGNLAFYIEGSGLPNWVDGGAAVPLNTWTHVALTFDGSTATAYVNGAATRTITGLSASVNVTSGPLRIGARSDACPSERFSGLIDEAEVYNRALVASEIATIFNAGSGGQCKPAPSCVPPPSGLVSWWRGEGNGNDATGANNGAVSPTGVTFPAGEVGQAFGFDGASGSVTIPDSPSLNPGQVTIEAWVRPDFTRSVQGFDGDTIFTKINAGSGYGLFVMQGPSFGALRGTLSFEGQALTGPDVGNGPSYFELRNSPPIPNDGQYHHVAGTYDGTLARVYLDGVKVDESSSYSGPIQASSVSAAIGVEPHNLLRYSSGAMDEVSLYNRALSASEIQAIFNAGSAGKCTGVCGNGIVEPGEQCDDGNTTRGDGCSATCQVEACYTCSGSPSACAPAGDGTACDDGVFCNGTDSCSGGTCSVHGVDPCASGGECNNVCNEATRSCAAPVGAPCTADGNVCTDDVCNGTGHCGVPNTAPCDDGLFCNGTDTCSGGTCSVHSGDPCLSGPECANTCDDMSGSCLTPAGTSCSSDDNPCTVDACDGSGTCAHQPGNAGAACRPAAGPCDAAESCDGMSSTCPADASKSDGSSCDDGNACTQSDQCTSGVCAGTPIPNCRVCGNGILEPGEQCDDGNTTAGDGCDSNCHYELIPGDGNGSSTSDRRACRVEWAVVNPKNSPPTDKHGRPNFVQTCQRGDQSCDFGSDAKACEFRVVACLNNVDPHLQNCAASGVGDPMRVMLFGPASGSQNHTAVMSALGDLRDPASGLGGFKLPLAATQVGMCTKPLSVRVALRGSGTRRHAGRVKLLAVSRAPRGAPAGTLVDIDRLTFICTP